MTRDIRAARPRFPVGPFSLARLVDLDWLARHGPLIIMAYFTAQFLMRIAISGNLETDEAQFVGLTHFALGYGNAHPPLYNWLVGLALELTGHWPASVALVKNGLLAGIYLLTFDTARRAAGSPIAGLCAAAALALMPQILWQSQFTLAHSVLVTFGAVALLHAATLVWFNPGSVVAYLYLGAAAALGSYGKYNFIIVLIAAAAAALSLPHFRARLLNGKLALSGAAFLLLFGPHALWALNHIESSSSRIAKLERENSTFGALDIPFLGVDGLLSVGLALLASAAPLLLVWFILRRNETSPAEPATGDEAETLRMFYGRTVLIGLALFSLIILLGDFHFVFERYLTPLLVGLPPWLVLALPLIGRAAKTLTLLAAGLWLGALTAMPAVVSFGADHLAWPYAAFARLLAAEVEPPIAIHAKRDRMSGNLAIRLPGSSVLRDEEPPDRVLLVWPGRGGVPDQLQRRLGEDFRPQGPVISGTFPYENFSGAKASATAQLFVRVKPD